MESMENLITGLAGLFVAFSIVYTTTCLVALGINEVQGKLGGRK